MALKEYNRNVYVYYENYINDMNARNVLESMTERFYEELASDKVEKLASFGIEYGGIATKEAKVHNTEVYDKRIALIICGWGRNQAGYWSFWNDANFTYWTLRSKGFTDNDIYFLYCNGTHTGYINYYGTIIDGNATRGKIDTVCGWINQNSTTNTLVFVMVTT
ncbi:MAG: hypothetical protein ACP5LE_06115, partial [Thermoplasmata archaeon]